MNNVSALRLYDKSSVFIACTFFLYFDVGIGKFCNHSILKRGKKWDQFKPSELPTISTVKPAKKLVFSPLLDSVGASEEVRAFYDDALAAPTAAGNAGSDSEGE